MAGNVAHAPRHASRRRARRAGSGQRLFAFDRRLGYRFVAGADEAGRGCLAGPLVAAGVLFDYEALTTRELRSLSALNDSKQHNARGPRGALPAGAAQRRAGASSSRAACAGSTRGDCTRPTSPRCAMRCAASRAELSGEVLCLVDGFSVAEFERPQRAIVDGDATSAAIAAASIVAKVTRDRYMHRADDLHPGWSFAEHVGYSTPSHREAILRNGVSPLHRMSFQSLAYQQLAL